MMEISQAGKDFIKSFEACRLKAYRDGGGVWTIGWGHTGKDVHEGLVWTQEKADSVFEVEVVYYALGVSRIVTVPLTQNEFDALVSFAYNVGLDEDDDTKAEGLGDSTLLRKLNDSDYDGAAAEFPKWNKDNGKIANGLTRRRQAEKALFERVS